MKLIAMLLLGVTLQYNTTFSSIGNGVAVDEKLEIVITNDVLRSNNQSKSDFIRKIETDYLTSLNLNGYDTQKQEEGNKTILVLSKRFTDPYDYANGTIFKDQLFGDVTVTDYSGQEYTVNYDGSFFASNSQYLGSGSYRINMSMPFQVSSNNATSSNGNIYTWNVNSNMSNINATFNTLAPSQQESSNPLMSLNFDFATIMLILIIGGLGLLTSFAFAQHAANNSI